MMVKGYSSPAGKPHGQRVKPSTQGYHQPMQAVISTAARLIRWLQLLTIAVFASFSGWHWLDTLASDRSLAHQEYSWLCLLVLSVLLSWWMVWLRRQRHPRELFFQLMALTVQWTLALALSGGVANPGNALLLLIVAMAFLLLDRFYALTVLVLICMVQLVFMAELWLATPGGHGHYLGMGATFLLSAALIAWVVSLLQGTLEQSQRELQAAREDQLRQEQVLAMGTATAQLTHELATPLATIKLLYEELAEELSDHPVITELAPEVTRAHNLLTEFREVTRDLQEHRQQSITVDTLEEQLRQHVAVSFPSAIVHWELSHEVAEVLADKTLLPALLNLLRNAIREAGEQQLVTVNSEVAGKFWLFRIENPATFMPQTKLQMLGQQVVPSDSGLGIGLMLSNATLERFGGRLIFEPGERQTIIQKVILPVTLPAEEQ